MISIKGVFSIWLHPQIAMWWLLRGSTHNQLSISLPYMQLVIQMILDFVSLLRETSKDQLLFQIATFASGIRPRRWQERSWKENHGKAHTLARKKKHVGKCLRKVFTVIIFFPIFLCVQEKLCSDGIISQRTGFSIKHFTSCCAENLLPSQKSCT